MYLTALGSANHELSARHAPSVGILVSLIKGRRSHAAHPVRFSTQQPPLLYSLNSFKVQAGVREAIDSSERSLCGHVNYYLVSQGLYVMVSRILASRIINRILHVSSLTLSIIFLCMESQGQGKFWNWTHWKSQHSACMQ